MHALLLERSCRHVSGIRKGERAKAIKGEMDEREVTH